MSRTGGDGGGAAGSVQRQGHLRKLKTMKRKYFVLRAETAESTARLEYYESEKKFRSGAAPRRVISLKTCFNITRRLDLKQRYVIALYLKEECFCIVPDGDEDLHLWLADLLKCHRADDSSEELLHPTQHVWQVNVQKKGLGATKNILGLYNLCLTDKTLTLVKIRPNNNSYDFCIPDRIECSLRNIRRCGDSECFFYMEVGRQTAIGPGELWMHTEDSNIAQSMHHTIYHAMTNCTKEREDKELMPTSRLRSVSATEDPRAPGRRHGYGEGRVRVGLTASMERGLCVGACIRQCVCASGTLSIEESAAAIAPLSPKPATNDNQPLNNSLILSIDPSAKVEGKENCGRTIKHHRTFSLPTGCAPFQEPLRISHERTRSAPLAGDEVDHAAIEKAVRQLSHRVVNGGDFFTKKQGPWNRRDSTGARFPKSSPGHSKNVPVMRNRCESMPSRTCPPLETERTPSRLQTNHLDGDSRDEPDSVDWHPTPGIPEEPDDITYCKMSPRDINVMNRTLGSDSGLDAGAVMSQYMTMTPGGGGGAASGGGGAGDGGYVEVHRAMSPAASSGSVCSGTPSTDPRFSEYQLDPIMAHIIPDEEERPPRAYSVGSRPAPLTPAARDRAYSVGARSRARPQQAAHAPSSSSAPLLPLLARVSAGDLMELDFSNNSPKTKPIIARTPPSSGFAGFSPSGLGSGFAGFAGPSARTPATRHKPTPDEYVDMSPRSGYVEMRPLDSTRDVSTGIHPLESTRDGYGGIRPLESPSSRDCPRTVESPSTRPLESPSTRPLESPSSRAPESQSQVTRDGYVEMTFKRTGSRPIAIAEPRAGSQTIFPLSLESPDTAEHPLATLREISEPEHEPPRLHYAALDLEPRTPLAPAASHTYTQIDFLRSEKLNAADGN